jgi:hypothetical protein
LLAAIVADAFAAIDVYYLFSLSPVSLMAASFHSFLFLCYRLQHYVIRYYDIILMTLIELIAPAAADRYALAPDAAIITID